MGASASCPAFDCRSPSSILGDETKPLNGILDGGLLREGLDRIDCTLLLSRLHRSILASSADQERLEAVLRHLTIQALLRGSSPERADLKRNPISWK
jgi:hypothetical protein